MPHAVVAVAPGTSMVVKENAGPEATKRADTGSARRATGGTTGAVGVDSQAASSSSDRASTARGMMTSGTGSMMALIGYAIIRAVRRPLVAKDHPVITRAAP